MRDARVENAPSARRGGSRDFRRPFHRQALIARSFPPIPRRRRPPSRETRRATPRTRARRRARARGRRRGGAPSCASTRAGALGRRLGGGCVFFFSFSCRSTVAFWRVQVDERHRSVAARCRGEPARVRVRRRARAHAQVATQCTNGGFIIRDGFVRLAASSFAPPSSPFSVCENLDASASAASAAEASSFTLQRLTAAALSRSQTHTRVQAAAHHLSRLVPAQRHARHEALAGRRSAAS